jgi:hypothetical protein
MNLLNKKPVFLNDWSDKEGVARDFETNLDNVNILFASYTYENYSGEAFVLFEQDGKLFEVNGGHCSCYGLEGQWAPEETTIQALTYRLTEGRMGQDSWDGNQYGNELKEFIEVFHSVIPFFHSNDDNLQEPFHEWIFPMRCNIVNKNFI